MQFISIISLSSKLKSFRRSDLGRTLLPELYDYIEDIIISKLELETKLNNAILNNISTIVYQEDIGYIDIQIHLDSYRKDVKSDPINASINLMSLVKIASYRDDLSYFYLLDVMVLASEYSDTSVLSELDYLILEGEILNLEINGRIYPNISTAKIEEYRRIYNQLKLY